MAFLALESARRRAARVGMMLARVFDGWEDRRASAFGEHVGQTGGIRRREPCIGDLAKSCSTLKPTCR